MLKPPAGEMTAATPAGGGAACPGWLPRRRKESSAKETRVSNRPLRGELFESISINFQSRPGAVWGALVVLPCSGPTLSCRRLKGLLEENLTLLHIRHNKSAASPRRGIVTNRAPTQSASSVRRAFSKGSAVSILSRIVLRLDSSVSVRAWLWRLRINVPDSGPSRDMRFSHLL
jgi:hypothetical protein